MRNYKQVRVLIYCVLAALLITGQHVVRGQQQQPSSDQSVSTAEQMYRAHRWAEAAEAYEAVTRSEPSNGMAWFRLGVSLYSLSKFGQAAAAFERASGLMQFPPATYNAASSYARAGDADRAFEWLKKAADAGFGQTDPNTDEDFAALRDDPRFAPLAKRIRFNADPCNNAPEYRQLDFWVGEWTVQGPGGFPPSSSSIQLIENRCVVMENFTGAQGSSYSGKSFNFYNASTGRWQEVWIDNRGGSISYVGEYRDGAMRLEGESHAANGNTTKVRMTLFNLGPNKVRQLAETSTDGGRTWKVSYDLTYTRKQQ